MVSFQDGLYNIDSKTLMIIVMYKMERMPQASKRLPNACLGPCYKCANDLLIKKRPYPCQPKLNQALLVSSASQAWLCSENGIRRISSGK